MLPVQAGMAGSVRIAIARLVFQDLIAELLEVQAAWRRASAHGDAPTSSPACQIARCSVASSTIASHRRRPAITSGATLLDLDRFEELNDTLGHHYGAEPPRNLGPRLAEAIGQGGWSRALGATSSRSSGEGNGRHRRLEAIAMRSITCVEQPGGSTR